ncbi:hypothetical protein RJ55_02867 [Drechmeria coniospora]|nr:hypothetical protein RJ55_02867 [Drechmeria coniospora]
MRWTNLEELRYALRAPRTHEATGAPLERHRPAGPWRRRRGAQYGWPGRACSQARLDGAQALNLRRRGLLEWRRRRFRLPHEQGEARQGKASKTANAPRRSTSQHVTARHSTWKHGTAQHSAAQRSTAKHSAARHGTVRLVALWGERSLQRLVGASRHRVSSQPAREAGLVLLRVRRKGIATAASASQARQAGG